METAVVHRIGGRGDRSKPSAGTSQPIMLDSPTTGRFTVSISQRPRVSPVGVWFLAAGTAVLGTDYTLALDRLAAGVTLSDFVRRRDPGRGLL